MGSAWRNAESTQNFHEFLREARGLALAGSGSHLQPGVEDWRVTSWGPQACFAASSLRDAAGLLPAIVDAAEQFDVEPDVDLRPEAVVIRIHYRGAERIPAGGPAAAAAISRAAAELGLTSTPELISTIDIAVAQHSDVDSRPFWNAVLNYRDYWDSDSRAPAWWTLASPDNHGVDIASWTDTSD